MTQLMTRLQRWWETLARWMRMRVERLWAAARDPRRVLPVLVVVGILVFAVPLTITGLDRVGRATLDWRASSSIRWRHAEGTVTRVRIDDGLVVHLGYRDRHHRPHQVDVFVGDAGGHWIGRRVPVRFDPSHHDRVEIVGLTPTSPLIGVLRAGAPLGVGVAGLVVALAVWRRRRLLAVSARPIAAVRRPLTVGAVIAGAGLAAWAVGTVWDQGWSAVASAIGHFVATAFGDMLGVLVPLVAFVLGCLVTAWLARHRHHDDHDDILSSAHRLIDRAAGMVPSPEELRPSVDESVRSGS